MTPSSPKSRRTTFSRFFLPWALVFVFLSLMAAVFWYSSQPVMAKFAGNGRTQQSFLTTINAWSQQIKLTTAETWAEDGFGFSVAISSDTIVIGVPFEDAPGTVQTNNTGAVYVFERNAGGTNAWGQTAKLAANDIQAHDHFGISVAIDGDVIAVGAYQEAGGPGDPITTAGAAYIFERNAGGANAWGQTAKLMASDPQTSDFFGGSVAVSKDVVVVGALGEDGGDGDPLDAAGAAYIFERNAGGNNSWGQMSKIMAGDAQAGDGFGRTVAVSEDTVIVGAYLEDGGTGDPTINMGAAYVFERNNGGVNTWGQVVKLTATDAQREDRFGWWVALDGDTAVIGADLEDGGPGDAIQDAGAVYIFERNQGGAGAWGQSAKLMADDAQFADGFGGYVALSGDTAVIGASSEDGGAGDPASNAGAAYVFARNMGGSNAWGQVDKLVADDAQVDDVFGWSVAVSGGTAVVGAWGEDGNLGALSEGAGAAYVFTGSYTLTVALAGNGGGTITSSPAGISCGSNCSESYAASTAVTLTAVADANSFFSGWSDACTGLSDCVLTMSVPTNVTATFTQATFVYLPVIIDEEN